MRDDVAKWAAKRLARRSGLEGRPLTVEPDQIESVWLSAVIEWDAVTVTFDVTYRDGPTGHHIAEIETGSSLELSDLLDEIEAAQ